MDSSSQMLVWQHKHLPKTTYYLLYQSLWKHESAEKATCFFWLSVSATALIMSSLANSPFLTHHAQGRRKKPDLTSSTLVPSHDSFHIPFSFFKQLQDKTKTLMSGFSQLLIIHNKGKSIVCRCKTTSFFFFFKHETCQWDTLRLPFRDTAWTSVSEQCRYPFTACP